MQSFLGTFTNSVDDKGRIAVPAKMRKAMKPENQDSFIVTLGFSGEYISVYPLDMWRKLESSLFGPDANEFDRELMEVARYLTRWADEVSLDSQGRISLSKQLLEKAGIGKSAMVCGVVESIEIWNPEKYDETFDGGGADMAEKAEAVMRRAKKASRRREEEKR